MFVTPTQSSKVLPTTPVFSVPPTTSWPSTWTSIQIKHTVLVSYAKLYKQHEIVFYYKTNKETDKEKNEYIMKV